MTLSRELSRQVRRLASQDKSESHRLQPAERRRLRRRLRSRSGVGAGGAQRNCANESLRLESWPAHCPRARANRPPAAGLRWEWCGTDRQSPGPAPARRAAKPAYGPSTIFGRLRQGARQRGLRPGSVESAGAQFLPSLSSHARPRTCKCTVLGVFNSTCCLQHVAAARVQGHRGLSSPNTTAAGSLERPVRDDVHGHSRPLEDGMQCSCDVLVAGNVLGFSTARGRPKHSRKSARETSRPCIRLLSLVIRE